MFVLLIDSSALEVYRVNLLFLQESLGKVTKEGGLVFKETNLQGSKRLRGLLWHPSPFYLRFALNCVLAAVPFIGTSIRQKTFFFRSENRFAENIRNSRANRELIRANRPTLGWSDCLK